MRATGKFLALGWTGLSLALPVALVGAAGGCSEPPGTVEQATRDEAGDKVVQDKMREFMSKKGAAPQKR